MVVDRRNVPKMWRIGLPSVSHGSESRAYIGRTHQMVSWRSRAATDPPLRHASIFDNKYLWIQCRSRTNMDGNGDQRIAWLKPLGDLPFPVPDVPRCGEPASHPAHLEIRHAFPPADQTPRPWCPGRALFDRRSVG